jgi:8-oxo-dGTP pyrophosphatase MutT (NUDIX family)
LIVCATVVKNGMVLLVKHSDPRKPDYDKWLLPAGKVESLEAPEEALHREIMEETGLKIKIVRRVAEHVDPYTGDRLLNFLCLPVTSRIKASSELAETMWFDRREIQMLRDIHPGLKRFLINGLKGDAFRG